MPVVRPAIALLSGRYAVCRLDPDAPVPAWACGGFVSVTRTAEELSVVCEEADVPPDVHCERGWRCMKLAGPLDFALVGVLQSLLAPLADAGVSVFAVSTYDTDYVLVREEDLDCALAALRGAGWNIEPPAPAGCSVRYSPRRKEHHPRITRMNTNRKKQKTIRVDSRYSWIDLLW